jgi:transcriptional regulator with XRE-family HTH domain
LSLERRRSGTGRPPRSQNRRGIARSGAPSLPTPAERIGQFLRRTREAQNLSQDQLAALTDGRPGRVSRATISAVERGRHLPGLDVLLTLSQVLHISPNEVLERLELARVADVDTAELSLDELERKASERFWAGDHRHAVACYDAMLRKLEQDDAQTDPGELTSRIARTELRRGAALRRCGATVAARGAVERAISLADGIPQIQAEAYVVLVALLDKLGCGPLARDAADRAVELADLSEDPRVKGWARIEKGVVLMSCGRYDEARRAYVQARTWVRKANDKRHEIHVEGNIAGCLKELGRRKQARGRYLKAVALSRRYGVPSLEAVWFVELGRLALDEGELDEAETCALAALKIAKPAEHLLTCFRAEWLHHQVQLRCRPEDPDRHRVAYLRRLYARLEDHRGIAEIQEFKKAYCNPPSHRGRTS